MKVISNQLAAIEDLISKVESSDFSKNVHSEVFNNTIVALGGKPLCNHCSDAITGINYALLLIAKKLETGND